MIPLSKKILEAVNTGLLNVLSTDIVVQNIDFDTPNIDNEYIPELSLEELYQMYQKNENSIFQIRYNTKNAVSLILDNNDEISLSEYKKGETHPLFLKLVTPELKQGHNEILIYIPEDHYIQENVIWKPSDKPIQPAQYLKGYKDAISDFNGYANCQRILKYASKTRNIEAVKSCKINIRNAEGYLPSAGQMALIYHYRDLLDDILTYIGAEPLNIQSVSWWTSNESPYLGRRTEAWYISTTGMMFEASKPYHSVSALPLFKLK